MITREKILLASFVIRISRADLLPWSIVNQTKQIREYRLCPNLEVDLSKVGVTTVHIENGVDFVVDVVDPVQDYSAMMKSIFDFKVSGNRKMEILPLSPLCPSFPCFQLMFPLTFLLFGI